MIGHDSIHEYMTVVTAVLTISFARYESSDGDSMDELDSVLAASVCEVSAAASHLLKQSLHTVAIFDQRSLRVIQSAPSHCHLSLIS